ncbi:hypothetical protein ACGFX4_17740 [Kitasatospora sp. NPDC048365]|uniref:hypothetical protein n=1 Tax=Kitasatospora sp. NPDC048365 TaxID=3364050 RepID=UPI0037172CA6
MPDTELVYESRHGWSTRTVVLLVGSLLLTAGLFLFDPSEPVDVKGFQVAAIWIQVPGFLLFGGGAAVLGYNAASRKVALRVDSTGVLLGGSPLRYAATTVLVPWSEIAAVELWIQRVGRQKLPYVGVHRHAGLPPLPGGTNRLGSAAAGKPAALVAGSRQVGGWPLYTPALLATVRRHAPATAIAVDPDFPAKV